jgi:hypothetical protein
LEAKEINKTAPNNKERSGNKGKKKGEGGWVGQGRENKNRSSSWIVYLFQSTVSPSSFILSLSLSAGWKKEATPFFLSSTTTTTRALTNPNQSGTTTCIYLSIV